uniref:RHS repeat domain-containing protein n=1 Tax=Aquimarina pacifica TaxID=1296415 RepID=UPI000552AF22
WGYNEQYPIAEIVNASYEGISSSAQSLINAAKSLSNVDVNETSETALKNKLQELREDAYFDDSQITTYTYDPLLGVTSITDPRGKTVYYEYDDFQRLKTVKDTEGNLLSTNEYNYKN